MTQNMRSMKVIEADAGVTGYLLRPLCAKNLEMTEPEKLGWVDREKLLDIQGRTRTTQLALAKEWGLEAYVKPPAGGCILTEEVYSRRLLDHLKHNKEMSREEMKLLNVGRHFRNGNYKFIVGRKESENKELLRLSKGAYVFDAVDAPGPIVLTFDEVDEEAKKLIASVTAGYSDAKEKESAEVKVAKEGIEEILFVKPTLPAQIAEKNI
jgi:tRNA-uridine 2-sulfurtransferase